MNCNIKNIPEELNPTTSANLGTPFQLDLNFYECALAPDFYLILQESTPENEIPLFTQHPRFIEVLESDIA